MSETRTARPLLRVGPLRFDVEPALYGTVVLMTVLVVALDDGVEDFAEAAQLVVGPLVATFAAHLFAAVLARASRDGALPRGAELRHLLGHAGQFLLLMVPPLVVVVAGALGALEDAEEAVVGILWLGFAFLVLVGGLGGWRAGRAWLAVVGAVAAGVLGLFVLALRLVLES